MRRRTRNEPVQTETVELGLMRRVHRHTAKGDQRKAMLALREACFKAGRDPRLWALYGHHCIKAGRLEDGLHALRQSLFFRERARDERRAAVLRRLLDQIESEAA
jgi:hypothetical protein